MPPTTSLSAAPVLVTGGSSGLGRAVVDALTAAGAVPLVVDPQPPAAEVEYRCVDLSDTKAAATATDELARAAGGLFAVVTAAGIDAGGRLEDVPAAAWERVVAVNLLGTAAVVRAALPHLPRPGGRVVTVASTLGLRALGDATAYCASKFGVVGFTRALARELAGDVDVTLLVPGGMRTPFFDGRPDAYRPVPDANLATPADVAGTVLFALGQPAGVVVRELVFTPSDEPSYP